ncbi:alpha/beta fold hydrolase [Kocuria sp. M1R5S2]|uniref:alpha/beta fold hydrolase n=1 Tax=Kocuria rhizosphaerae TaxID=3376285 RepID=UPI00378AA999
MSGTEYETWGAGERVVLVHGSFATGPLEWEGQRVLAELGYQLVVPTRRAYLPGHAGEGEDFLTDGDDVAELLGNGAHLVGHSYGGLSAMVAAAARPEAVRSLVLAEPPVFGAAPEHPAVAALRERTEAVFARQGTDQEFVDAFLRAVGTSVEDLPQELVSDMEAMAPAVRLGRPPWGTPVPLGPLAGARFPVLVVSGNHHPAFTAMCEALARDLGAEHRTVEGAGHEVQLVTEGFNAALLELWRRAGTTTT